MVMFNDEISYFTKEIILSENIITLKSWSIVINR